MNETPENQEYTPIEDNIELSPEAQKMFDEMDGTFDEEPNLDTE